MKLLIVWELTCLALFWSVFCRSVLTNQTTRLDVRVSLLLMGIAAMVGLVAPIYGWVPDFVVLTIVLAVVVMQGVMAKAWGQGVPPTLAVPVTTAIVRMCGGQAVAVGAEKHAGAEKTGALVTVDEWMILGESEGVGGGVRRVAEGATAGERRPRRGRAPPRPSPPTAPARPWSRTERMSCTSRAEAAAPCT